MLLWSIATEMTANRSTLNALKVRLPLGKGNFQLAIPGYQISNNFNSKIDITQKPFTSYDSNFYEVFIMLLFLYLVRIMLVCTF